MNPVLTAVNNYHRNLRKIIKYLTYLIFIQQIFLTTFIVCQPNNQIDLQGNLNFNNNNKIVEFDVSKPTKSRKYNSSIEQNNQKKSSKKGKHLKKHRKHVFKFSTINSEENSSFLIKNNLKLRQKQQQQQNHLDPSKIYFDYYPVEKVDVNYDPAEDDKISVILLSKIKTNEYDKNDDYAFNHTQQGNHNKHEIIKTDRRRIKRDTTTQVDNNKKNIELNNNNQKNKRHANYIQKFINYEQGAGYQYNPPAAPSYSTATAFGNYYTFGTPNDPWNNEYNRYYANLPPQPPTAYGVYLKYPIRGIYYNPISPSGNNFGPPYLDGNGETPMEPGIEDRFDNDPDRPVWDRRPLNNNVPNQPTIPPSQPQSTSPPLIHTPKRPGSNSAQQLPQQQFPQQQLPATQQQFPATQQPSPTSRPEIRPPNDFRDGTQGGGLSSGGFSGNSNTIADTQQEQQPSRCVWAIVTCCTRNTMNIRYSCFEQMGCHGAFWDLNPCADQYRRAALAETSKNLE